VLNINMLNLKISTLAIITFSFFLVSWSGLALATQYPLKLNTDNRHLEDQLGQPFLINGDTPWSLIVGLTKTEADFYLEDRRSRGFNSVIVNLIEHAFGGPANREGNLPFNPVNDFTQPNELYFQHADWVINKAAEKGILVILTPAYLGYNCGSEGWCSEVKATSLANLRGYGNYLGNRYKDYDNVIWMHGGDVAAGDFGALDHVNAIADGIREIDPGKLFTAHGVRWSSAINDYNEPWLEINNTYSDCNSSALNTRRDFQHSPVIPFFYAEGRYEGESSTDGRCLRSQAYWSVLGGSTGHFFGNNPIWLFATGWEAALDLPGSHSMTYFGDLFATRPWSLLVPDYDEAIVGGNRGNITTNDYVMAARASDGSVIMAYLPKSSTVTVNMATVAGSAADAWWYDPENGNSQYIGEFTTSGLQNFTPPDNSDWVLVIDNADLGFPTPGETGPAQCADGVDNDTDGFTDFPADPGCTDALDNDETDPMQCADGIDNDTDGLTDFPADPGCTDALDNDETDPMQCADGIDNDTDGLTDFPADPGCTDALDNDETDPPQCADGIDNDTDGLTDFPADPGCTDALDNDETDPPQCADGVDNDTDGLTDFPADPGCTDALDNDETDPMQCADGIDNDTDGLTDFPADPGCTDALDNDETDPPPAAQCADGLDNDTDGLTDFPADPGCTDALDNDETDPPPAAQCADGLDNDTDGLTDFPADPGCTDALDNDETDPPPAAQCADGLDNDTDGLTDFPADPGCTDALDNDETDLPQCADGIDNDTDGLTDFPADPGCTNALDNDETDPPPAAHCADGVDNDTDGLTDFPADPGCTDALDNDETDLPQCADGVDNDTDGLTDFPADPGCVNASDNDETDPPPAAQCADGVDNDTDGLTDFPADPGCVNASDNDETDPPPAAQCADGVDNDTDGFTDFPADPGCVNASDNDETDPPPAAQCADGVDNDTDGLTDFPADPGCVNASDNDETDPPPVVQCADGVDNDSDTFIDFPDDPGCTDVLDNDESNDSDSPARCNKKDALNDPECSDDSGDNNNEPPSGNISKLGISSLDSFSLLLLLCVFVASRRVAGVTRFIF